VAYHEMDNALQVVMTRKCSSPGTDCSLELSLNGEVLASIGSTSHKSTKLWTNTDKWKVEKANLSS